MGTDIMTNSGLVYEARHMVKLLQAKDVSACNKICKEYTSGLDAAGKKNFAAVISCITDTKEQTALPKWVKALGDMDAMVKKNKWLDDYENQEMYEYLGQVSELWTLILEEIRPTMQRFDEVRVFESGRNNGWDVPIGKVCFIFSDYGMFKTTLTAEGKAFEKHMGKVEKVEWTDISC